MKLSELCALACRKAGYFNMTRQLLRFTQDDSNLQQETRDAQPFGDGWLRTGGMERNEQRNERSGVQDIGAAVRNEGGTAGSMTNCGA